MKMMKVLTIFLIGLITLTTINTALAADLDNDRTNIQKDIDHLIDQIDEDAVPYTHIRVIPEPTIDFKFHNDIHGWHYEEFEVELN